MKTKLLLTTIFAGLWFFGLETSATSQCESWTDLPNKEDVINAHSIYRQAIRVNDMEIAYENWKIAYQNAPTADGQRDFHFTDGIAIYKYLIGQTEDEDEIARYREKIIQLYEQCASCYKMGTIALRSCNTQECYDKRAGVILGRMVYDMFYEFNSPSDQVFDAAVRAMDLTGLDTEYIVVVPAAGSMVRLFRAGQLDDETARDIHSRVSAIVEHNIENNEAHRAHFEAVKPSVDHFVAQIEHEIYDCDYFKDRLIPQFEARPHDGELARSLFSQLVARGCDEDDPDLAAIRERNKQFVDSVNVALQEDLETRNPAIAARRLFEEGDYRGAIERFQQAIELEESDERKGEFFFRIASIQGRNLNQYSSARSNALRAAELRPNWGAPFMLIGDLYAASSRDCGDSWNQRLAVLAAIDKYQHAARIDPEVRQDANRRAAAYRASKPEEEEAFMRGLSKGDRVTVSCWFNETVTLRFK
ncbi:MAG: hypothetical protein EA409_03420 [Saprospirales bacterium]|nr:MAG: hypothetical protein EA409_03420 [Saprospirales bacterium]